MLEKDPAKRLSSKDALNHDAFMIHLSKSPLIVKPNNEAEGLNKFKHITDANNLKANKIKANIPDKMEDLSPAPTVTNQKSKFSE